jgi:hypothetical protein
MRETLIMGFKAQTLSLRHTIKLYRRKYQCNALEQSKRVLHIDSFWTWFLEVKYAYPLGRGKH